MATSGSSDDFHDLPSGSYAHYLPSAATGLDHAAPYGPSPPPPSPLGIQQPGGSYDRQPAASGVNEPGDAHNVTSSDLEQQID